METSRLNQELLAMVRIASTILQYNELDDILAAITRELAQVIRFDRSSVAFMAPDGKSLTLKHIQKGDGRHEKPGDGRAIPLDEKSVIGWVALNRRAIVRRDISSDGRFLEVVKEESLACDMIAPLVARGKVIGTINVGCYEANMLADSDLEMLVNCSNIACGAIEHIQLLTEATDLGERYRMLRRDASDIILLVDKNTGRLIEVNRKCCEALGLSEEDLLKRSYFDLFPREDQFQARRDFINILSRKNSTFVDRRLNGRDGRIIFVDMSASLITTKDKTFIQVLVHDISQRRMLEQQIIHQNRNLQVANRKLRDVDQMKTEFLGNISHELRTPLSIIISYTESLRDPQLSPDERTAFVGVISQNGQHLLKLIDDLLDLSRLEASGAMLSPTLSHMHDVVRALWPRATQAAGERGLDVTFEPGVDIPVVCVDNRRIEQVLYCLVHNAIKFTETGGRVTVTTSLGAEGVRVDVMDTGSGIPVDKLASIFEPFRQGDGSATRRFGGLGIGLAMARHIIELHGGRIWVNSEPGRGSTFSFVLPADRDVPAEKVAQSMDAAAAPVGTVTE